MPIDTVDAILPCFRYHPDPIATGSIVRGDSPCPCCDKVTGLLYSRNLHCPEEVSGICPWCIADGTAAAKFNRSFNDASPLLSAGINAWIIETVTRHTPGYCSWQGDDWQTCCNDACAFLGDLSASELKNIPMLELRSILWDSKDSDEQLLKFVRNYTPGGSPAIYSWLCLHCGRKKYNADSD